jgi:cell surface protein SprA
VVENSVRVLLNGRELTPNVDYTVDYNIGSLTIRNDAALVPGADLRITYEQNDLFQLASKTLLGARGLYEFSKRHVLVFLY